MKFTDIVTEFSFDTKDLNKVALLLWYCKESAYNLTVSEDFTKLEEAMNLDSTVLVNTILWKVLCFIRDNYTETPFDADGYSDDTEVQFIAGVLGTNSYEFRTKVAKFIKKFLTEKGITMVKGYDF